MRTTESDSAYYARRAAEEGRRAAIARHPAAAAAHQRLADLLAQHAVAASAEGRRPEPGSRRSRPVLHLCGATAMPTAAPSCASVAR